MRALCPYRIGQRVRALKLLRSVTESMLSIWDRGLHSYRMVNATLAQGCQYLARVPANVKFPAHKVLDDGSYLSWINPDRKSNKQGSTKIQVRVIEYTIETDGELKTYRLITRKHGFGSISCFVVSTAISSTVGGAKIRLMN